MRYSVFSLVRNAVSNHERWGQAWRSPDPRPHYDVIVKHGAPKTFFDDAKDPGTKEFLSQIL